MRLQQLSSVFAIVALSVTLVAAQAQTYNPKDRKQMRQLAFESCSKTASEQICNCFADQLIDNFSDKEWTIFIADTEKRPEPPPGVGEADLIAYGNKLAAAGNACGMK